MTSQQQAAQLQNAAASNQQSSVPFMMAGGAQGIQIPASASLMTGGRAVVVPGMSMPISMPIASIANMMMAQGLTIQTAPTAQQQQQQAPSELAGYSHAFPVKLHKIISNPEYSEFIAWLPHGRSWRVLKPRAFEEEVIPKFFRHAKFASFMRQVNGWGFKRVTQGVDNNSYYHELFLRGSPKLCHKMKRPSKVAARGGVADTTNTNPDVSSVSVNAPLPNQTFPVASAVSTLPTSNGIASDSVVSVPATSSDSDPTSSDSDRNNSAQNQASREGNQDSGGSYNSPDVTNACENVSGSDPNGPDTDRNSGLEGMKSSTARTEVLDRVETTVKESDPSKQSAQLQSSKQTDFPSTGAGATQDVSTLELPVTVGPCTGAAGLGLPTAAATLPGIGQGMLQHQVGSSGVTVPPAVNLPNGSTMPLMAPLAAANLSAVNQISTAAVNPLAIPLAAMNQQLPTNPLATPLTATNLTYLTVQNQLIQSQSKIAQLLAYQQQINGLPPMPPANGEIVKQQGGSNSH